jgi:hypothetical protein
MTQRRLSFDADAVDTRRKCLFIADAATEQAANAQVMSRRHQTSRRRRRRHGRRAVASVRRRVRLPQICPFDATQASRAAA